MPLTLRWLAILFLTVAALGVGKSAGAEVEPWECEPGSAPSAAASASPTAPPEAIPFPSGRLLVSAAASLTDAFTKIGEDIMSANPQVLVQFNFAGSQTLVTQIEGGASADVLAVASPEQMMAAIDAGIAVDPPRTFASNRLIVVVPGDNPAGISSVADLASGDVRLVLANPDVPAGAYAREMLCNVAAAEGAPSVDDFAGNVVSEEDNVRSVLTKVQLGEADAGIVYETDARAAGDEIKTVAIPAEQNVVAYYPIASINGDRLGAAFVAYVLSPEGQATLASFGFDPVSAN
jgi:molybdate transport system substrate-binding protein